MVDTGGDGSRQSTVEQFLRGSEQVGLAHRGSVVLLDTVDVRSGQVRSSLALFVRDDERLIAFGSHRTTRDNQPEWYDDILAEPQVSVRLWDGDRLTRFDAVAESPPFEDRDRLFRRIAQAQPAWAEYSSAGAFPMVVLHPR